MLFWKISATYYNKFNIIVLYYLKMYILIKISTEEQKSTSMNI